MLTPSVRITGKSEVVPELTKYNAKKTYLVLN